MAAGGGGMFGGRNGGRLTFSMNHTITLKDELEIAPGLPLLDYLDGEALGSTGGRSRHVIEAEAGYYNNGLGARLSTDWRSATRVDSTTGPDLKFDDYATVDLRLFANLGERFDLVAKNRFFLGSSVRFEVKNLFNARPNVSGSDGDHAVRLPGRPARADRPHRLDQFPQAVPAAAVPARAGRGGRYSAGMTSARTIESSITLRAASALPQVPTRTHFSGSRSL